MTDQTPKPVDLVPANTIEEPLNQKEGFLQRALNRTKEAFRNVDEAITGRETFRHIEQRLQRQDEINETYKASLEEALTQVAIWKEEFEQELSDFSTRTKQQQAFFEEKITEITTTSAQMHNVASIAEQTLLAANTKQQEVAEQAKTQLQRWQDDARSLKTEVSQLREQLSQLQHSFKQLIIALVISLGVILIAVLGYLIASR